MKEPSMENRRLEDNIQNPSEQYRNDLDLREAYGGKFIKATRAEGESIHNIGSGDISIPVSFAKEAGRFRISGIQEETNKGVIISGIMAGGAVRINHVLVDKTLQGTGIGKALLAHTEEQLKTQGIKIIYATFANPVTVDFLLKNQYEIVPFDFLSEEIKTQLDIPENNIEPSVKNKDNFLELKSKLEKDPDSDFKLILLYKRLD